MRRLFVFVMFLLPGLLFCQEEDAGAYVYESYYEIRSTDLAEWNRRYRDYSVPVLRQLQEEGLIAGWDQWEHHTGGDGFNVRFAVQLFDWASINAFWREYLQRLEAETHARDGRETSRLIVAHRDEIWNISETSVPPALNVAYIYAAKYGVDFSDMEEWNRIWSDFMEPLIEDATAEGLLVGWIRLDHNTGGPHNSQDLFLFENWEGIHDFLMERMEPRLMERQPLVWARINELYDAHEDVIWVPTPRN